MIVDYRFIDSQTPANCRYLSYFSLYLLVLVIRKFSVLIPQPTFLRLPYWDQNIWLLIRFFERKPSDGKDIHSSVSVRSIAVASFGHPMVLD